MKKLISVILACIMIAPTVFAEDKDGIKLVKSGIEGVDEKIQRIVIDYETNEIEHANIDYAGENFLVVSIVKDNNYYSAVIDYNGNYIIRPGEYINILGGEDLLAVQKYNGGKYGYISLAGEYVIPPAFDYASEFSEGLAAVKKGDLLGYIDKTGNLVKTFPSDGYSLRNVSDGIAQAMRLEITDRGEFKTAFELYDSEFRLLFQTSDYFLEDYVGKTAAANSTGIDANKSVLMDIEGNVVFEAPADTDVLAKSYSGDILIYKQAEDGRLVSIIDEQGNALSNEIKIFGSMEPLGDDYYVLGEFTDDMTNVKLYNDKLEYIMDVGSGWGFNSISDIDKFVSWNTDNESTIIIDMSVKNKEYEPISYAGYEEFPENNINVVFKAGDNRAEVNGNMKLIDPNDGNVRTFIKDGRIMLPVRFVTETIPGYNIDWSIKDQTITISGDKQIIMTVGENKAVITEFDSEENDYVEKTYELEVPPVISEDRTFVPLRFIAEITGRDVGWNDNGIALIGSSVIPGDAEAEYINKFDGALLDLSEYPVIDGSTATIPLSQALTARALGISTEQAAEITYHTKTSNSFERLINREADLLLSGGLNEDKIAAAAEKGIELEAYAVAKEGFVFMLNGKNPVKNLTTSQIQDIYQGKITNWRELGGNDAEIIPFQRNEDSGSQSIMKRTVMKGLEMTPPKTETLITAMGGIVDAVAEFDNSENSIGYSVYYYFSQMHNRDEVLLASVDGIEPNNENIRDGSYPFVIDYCVMIRKDEPENSPARKLVNFLLSEEGAELVSEAGFVSIR